MSIVQQQQTAEATKIVSEGEDFSDTANDIANFEVNLHNLCSFFSLVASSERLSHPIETRPPNVYA